METQCRIIRAVLSRISLSLVTDTSSFLCLGGEASFTCRLPDLSRVPSAVRQRFLESVIDRMTRSALESGRVLNWCKSLSSLYPVITEGDGNCLMHAASIFIWGFHDNHLLLRTLVYRALVNDIESRYMVRWQADRERKDNDIHCGGLEYTCNEWKKEWDVVAKQASPQKQQASLSSLPYLPLEELHIFVLANILRRPIIVMADNVVRSLQGDAFAPNYFSGIYLPLLVDDKQCVKSPVVLGYNGSHFVPLLFKSRSMLSSAVKKSSAQYSVPLVTANLEPLTLHFMLPSERTNWLRYVKKYLLVREVPLQPDNLACRFLAAQIIPDELGERLNVMRSYLRILKRLCETKQPLHYNILANEPAKTAASIQQNPSQEQDWETVNFSSFTDYEMSVTESRCHTPDCSYYSSKWTYPYCHECADRFANVQRFNVSKELLLNNGASNNEQCAKQLVPCQESNCSRTALFQGFCDLCYYQFCSAGTNSINPSLSLQQQTERNGEKVQNVHQSFAASASCETPKGVDINRTKWKTDARESVLPSWEEFSKVPASLVQEIYQMPRFRFLNQGAKPAADSAQERKRTCIGPGCESSGVSLENGLCIDCYSALKKLRKVREARTSALTESHLSSEMQHEFASTTSLIDFTDDTQAPSRRKNVKNVRVVSPFSARSDDFTSTSTDSTFVANEDLSYVDTPFSMDFDNMAFLPSLSVSEQQSVKQAPAPVKKREDTVVDSLGTPKSKSSGIRCRVNGCSFYGDPELNLLCSKCFALYTKEGLSSDSGVSVVILPTECAAHKILLDSS